MTEAPVPSVETWLADLRARWLPTDPVRPSRALDGRLRVRYEVVARLQPDRIVEIGVRAGYSAFAMLSAAPDAQYLGIDVRTDAHGGLVGSHEHAARLLARFDGVEFLHADSQSMDLLPPKWWGSDLVHVDGDHTEAGCLSDLALANRSGIRWALVDDVEHIQGVRRAIDAWAERHGTNRVERLQEPHRGAVLMDLRGLGASP